MIINHKNNKYFIEVDQIAGLVCVTDVIFDNKSICIFLKNNSSTMFIYDDDYSILEKIFDEIIENLNVNKLLDQARADD